MTIKSAVCCTGNHNAPVVEPLSVSSHGLERQHANYQRRKHQRMIVALSKQHQESHSGPAPFQHGMLSFHGELHTVPLVLLLLLKLPGFVTQTGKKIFIFSNVEVFFF